MSGKSFIENVQNSGVSAMLGGTPSLERTEEPKSDLINTDVPEVKIDTGKIINQTGSSLVGGGTMESTNGQTLLQKGSANFYKNLQTARNQAEKNKAEKEKLTKQDVYEDTAKIETYAGVDESGKQYAPSQARKEYEKSQKIKQSNIYKNVTSAYGLIETKFPEYWTTTDGNKVYRTDGNYVVNQPVGTTSDFLGTLQDAYNSVTYAYANDGVLLTPEDLKKAYPEYKNVSDGVLSNFISGCQWDVMNGKRSDIQTVANSMGELAKTSGYTSRWDSVLDILSDESIIKYGMYGKMNTQKNLDLINGAMILKSIVSGIREVGAFNEGESDWKILSTFRGDGSEYGELIDLYMTDLENADLLTGIDGLITRLNENYLGNYEGAKTDLAIEDFVDRDMIRELNRNVTSYYSDKVQEVVENVRAQSEDEIWFPMKNFLERTMTGKYFKDNEGNYYLESVIGTEKLAFSRQSDGTYLDGEGHIYSEEQVKALTKGGLINGTVNAALNIANSLAEGYVDVGRFMEDPSLQYGIALASDAFSTYFDVMMTNPVVQLSLNAPVAGPATSWAMEGVMDVSGKMFMGALEMFGLLNGWTSESKDKAEELGAVVGLGIGMRVLGNVKRDMKTGKVLPRVEGRKRALQIALERYVKRISDSVMRLDRKKIERMIDEKREQIKEEERKRLLETEITEEGEQKEIKQREIKEETKQKEAQLEKEREEKLDSIPNMFTVPRKALKDARDNFFNDFYEEYKKLVGEENMDADVKMQKDLNDMMNSDPEKAKEFMDTYNDIYRQKELERMAEDIIELGRDLEDLNRQVREGLDENQRKELAEKEGVKYVSTKDVQDKKKTKVEKKYEKVEKEYLSLGKMAREDIRKNPYRDILKTIFDKVMEVVRNKKGKPKEYVRTLDNDISRVKIQEMIIEEWKNRAQEIMNQLSGIKKKLFDFRKKNFDTKISMDIKSFFTNFLKNTNVDNILSRMFKNGDIDIVETVDENFNRKLEVVYTGKAQTPSPQIQEAMYFLQKFIDSALEYQKNFNWDGKILENELGLYNLRSLLRDKGWNRRGDTKVGESAIASQDLYRLFNAFIDEYKDITGVGKSLRLYDEMFVDLFDITDIFEGLFNKDGEIRKESRNRLIKIRETFPDTIEALEKLIPGTKEILDLVETGPEILREMVKLAEKVDYKTWVEKHLFRYTPMMATMLGLKAVLPWWLSAMIGAAVGEGVGNWFKKKFGRLVPLQKEIDAVMDELGLTDEEKKKVREQRPKDFEKTLIDIDNTFEERLNTELDGEFEKDKREDNTPKTYDEEGNEVIYTEGRRNNDGDTGDTGGNGGGNGNPPSGGNGGGSKTDTLENTNKNEETTSGEGTIKEGVPENWDKMTDYQKLQYVLEKYNNYVNLTLDELKILGGFLELEEERAADAKRIKRAKMTQIAFMRKAIGTIVDRLSDAEKEKLRDDVIFAKSMMKKGNYKELQKKIEKTQGFAKLIYTRALYDMMLLGTAPTADVKVNYDEVRKKDIENADPNISASSGSEDLTEAMYELWGEEDPFGYGTDFAQHIFKAVRDMRFRRKNWGDVDGDIIDKYDFVGDLRRNNEQYENFTKEEIYDIVVNAIEKAWSIEYRRPRTTLKSERDKMKVKAAEGKRILEEVGEPIGKDKIKSRENIWFSFENVGKGRTRTDNNGGKISVGQGVDKIDGGLLRGRAWIQWKNNRTTIMVSDLAVFDNFPQLARLLPEDTTVFNLEDGKDYSIEQILREDASGKTQKERVEQARKEIFEKYPSQKELDDFFAKEYEKEHSKEDIKEDVKEEDKQNEEKPQVQPSEEMKSEPQETQDEQSTTKEGKTTNIDDMVVLDIEDYNEIKKYKGNLRKIFDEAGPDDYVYFSHNTSSENVDAIKKEGIRSYASRKVDKHGEDSPALNRGTLEESNGYGGNQFYFRMKKSEAEKYWANRAAGIIMFARDIAPEDIVALSRPIDYNIGQMLGKYNKGDLFKYWENGVKEFGYDVVKESMVNKYGLTELWEQFEKETGINKSIKEEKTSNPEDIEEYFKPEKSDFDISELTEEELHANISGEMPKEYNEKIGEEILKRFEARYDKLTLNDIRHEIEMADMWYGKEVKKKFKDLLKRKEKDEIGHLFGEDKPVDWKKVGNMSRMKPENLLKEPDSKEKFHAMEKQMLKLGNQYLSNGTSSFAKKYKAKYDELRGKYKQTPKEEFDTMFNETPVEELNVPRDKIDDLIGQIEKRTGANMEVEFSMDKDNKLMATIRRRPKEGIIGQDWYSKFVYDLRKDRPEEKVMYEMKRIEDEINGIILPF